jgi:hypothetical protein
MLLPLVLLPLVLLPLMLLPLVLLPLMPLPQAHRQPFPEARWAQHRMGSR